MGRALNRYKMGKYFRLVITKTSLPYARHAERIARDVVVDGLYVLRTSVPGSVRG